MISRTPTLAEWPYPMVRLACDYCPRRGQYRKETLLARFGGDVPMPGRAAPDCGMRAQECAGPSVRGVLCGSAGVNVAGSSEAALAIHLAVGKLPSVNCHSGRHHNKIRTRFLTHGFALDRDSRLGHKRVRFTLGRHW
jgi:hypothetical protein